MFTGCMSKKTIVRKYYTIEIPAGLSPVTTDSVSVIYGSCIIDQVTVNPIYKKKQIVSRTRSHEINYYLYHQWAIEPSEAVKNMIQEYLESSGIFRSVSTRYSLSLPDYRLGTHVKRLELIESNRSFSAHLDLEFRIIDNSDDRVILAHKADRTIELEHKDLNIFALEVSKIICGELNMFIRIIEDNRYLFPMEL